MQDDKQDFSLRKELAYELEKAQLLRRLHLLGGRDVPLRRFVGNDSTKKMPAVRLLETERQIVMRRDGKEVFVSLGVDRG
jgi:hypothetical protein